MGSKPERRRRDKRDSICVHFKPTVWFYLIRDMRENIPVCTKMFHGYPVGRIGEKVLTYDCKEEKELWLN